MLKFLKIVTMWSNAELGLIKICLISVGICVGIFFHQQLQSYVNYLLAAFVVTAVWTLILWFKKTKRVK